MPFLVCDPPSLLEQVEYYTLAGLPGDPQSPYLEIGQYGFKFDLGDVPPGTYSIRCSACNKWSCSLPSPLVFTRPENALAPAGFRLVF
jgi:hypothetical protein